MLGICAPRRTPRFLQSMYGKKGPGKHMDVATIMRYFWSMQQQFFKQLLISLKVDKAT